MHTKSNEQLLSDADGKNAYTVFFKQVESGSLMIVSDTGQSFIAELKNIEITLRKDNVFMLTGNAIKKKKLPNDKSMITDQKPKSSVKSKINRISRIVSPQVVAQ